MSTSEPKIDLAGVGSPIMDLVARVPDSFLANVSGEKGGMVLVDNAEMERIISLLDSPPAITSTPSLLNPSRLMMMRSRMTRRRCTSCWPTRNWRRRC